MAVRRIGALTIRLKYLDAPRPHYKGTLVVGRDVPGSFDYVHFVLGVPADDFACLAGKRIASDSSLAYDLTAQVAARTGYVEAPDLADRIEELTSEALLPDGSGEYVVKRGP